MKLQLVWRHSPSRDCWAVQPSGGQGKEALGSWGSVRGRIFPSLFQTPPGQGEELSQPLRCRCVVGGHIHALRAGAEQQEPR